MHWTTWGQSSVRRWLAALLLLTLALSALPALPAAAVEPSSCTVTNTNDSDAGSLRECINNATAGATITVTVTGTITLTRALEISRSLTIVGPGADQLAISGNNVDRVIDVSYGTVGISGVTIRGGNAGSESGGGIANSGTLTLTNSIVTPVIVRTVTAAASTTTTVRCSTSLIAPSATMRRIAVAVLAAMTHQP